MVHLYGKRSRIYSKGKKMGCKVRDNAIKDLEIRVMFLEDERMRHQFESDQMKSKIEKLEGNIRYLMDTLDNIRRSTQSW
jgi:hypothetical protein